MTFQANDFNRLIGDRLLVPAQYLEHHHGRATAGFTSRPSQDGGDLGRPIEPGSAVFEAKFMLPWAFSEERRLKSIWRSFSTACRWLRPGRPRYPSSPTAAKWIEITIFVDPLYQHLVLTAEKKFWRCVQSGEASRLFGAEPPRLRLAAIRRVDMSCLKCLGEPTTLIRPFVICFEKMANSAL